jgi:hypothetical protein
MYTRRDLAARLAVSGLHIPEERIWTSALATADFLHDQRPHGSAFVIGEAGLLTALHEAGYTLTERAPDCVVIGETRTYSFERITRAIRLIAEGARFNATNPTPPGRAPRGRVEGNDRRWRSRMRWRSSTRPRTGSSTASRPTRFPRRRQAGRAPARFDSRDHGQDRRRRLVR